LSHGHDDHYGGFLEFIQRYHDKYELKTVMANLPDNAIDAPPVYTQSWQNCIKKWAPVFDEFYPDCVFYKPHTGDKIQFADVTIEVLLTHEDLVDPVTGKTTITADFNDTSTVSRISTEGMSMIIMGDASYRAEAKLPEYYDSFIEADILQLAHHAANEMPNTYALIKATHAFIPTCIERLNSAKYDRIIALIRKYATKEYYFGSHEKTVGLAYRNGQITEIYP
jgi:beta-lactamase superfamily II metal-dependent hydrolase